MSKIILEKNIPFSQSSMWHDQKKYYNQKGIDAWEEDVPFYITSNPFIAKQYAEVIIRFIQDWSRNNPDTTHKLFYILELGSGTGQFSFYLLKNIVALQEALNLTSISIRYVMSDITVQSFAFWEKQVQLQPYLTSGMLDFALYDLYHGGEFILHRAQKTISEKEIHHPLIIIANYIFDSIATDVFTVVDGKLFESRVTIQTEDGNVIAGVPKEWEKIEIVHTPHEINNTYYNDALDPILFQYQRELIDTHFQFPVASLKALQQLQKLSHHQFLLLTSDKGYSCLDELDNCDYPELDFHGSFSVMVNFHAIGEFLKQSGGHYQLQSFRDNIVTGVFSSGFSLNSLSETALSIQKMIRGFSPTDYFLVYEYFIEHYKSCTLELMAAYLNLSAWDPYVFDHISDRFCELAEEGDPEVISFLSDHMMEIANNFYFSPGVNDIFFDIALFFQNTGRFLRAMEYYHLSQHYFGQDDVVLFNIAMCLYNVDRQTEALEYLRSAQALNPSAIDVQEWIDIIIKK
ncbi:MAG: tetratricopeptide repeat family protein [uncultured bacterium]|nr:MAG: tetratricopeptide repeat family protein [uncultured bacterium]